MPGYQPISTVASSLQTNPEKLLDFCRKGWIESVERNNLVYLAADQRYRAKYILYLCEAKRLTDDEIQLVLSVQRPPYSAAQVPEILKRHATDPNAGG